MTIKLNLIAARCKNFGIGKNGDLPWRLKTEMNFFTNMTSLTNDSGRKNVVIMGRRTWESIPSKFKPLANRINFVLSKKDLNLLNYKDSYAFKSLDDALTKLNDETFKELYENVWVIGGSHIYKETMLSKCFHRLYITEIDEDFDCDTFFPKVEVDMKEVSDPLVPKEMQEENGIQFVYKVYESVKSC